MKTSESRQSTRRIKEKKRLTSSFFLTCLVYLPAFVFAWSTVPEPNFKAAGDQQMIALSFAQLSGGGAPSAEPVAPQPQAQPEPEPEPEVISEPKPEPEVVTKPQPKPEPVVKKENKPKPKVQLKPKKQPEPKKKVVKQPSQQPVEKPAQDLVKEPQQASNALAQSAAPADQGAATASAQGGISTLVYGEREDPFLSQVKRCIESVLRYPRRARQLRLEGTVMVQFVVKKDGSLDELTVYESSGQVMLDNLARKAVEAAEPLWGEPRETVRLRMPIRYELK